MANLSNDDEEGISLFPMFNILACTLGVMVFILATVATVSLGADKAIEIVEAPIELPDSSEMTVEDAARGAAERRRPIWIEWDGVQLTIYPSMETVGFDRDLRSFDSWDETYAYISERLTGTRLGASVAQVGLEPELRYVVLLVRPSGFDNLLEIGSYFEFLGIDVAHEPINQQWQRVRVN